MHKEKLFRPGNVLAALALTLFVVAFAVVFTLMFRPLYYFDMGYLDIPARAGMAEAEIRANYDALIDYNGLFYRGALVFPTLPMSESGRVHFAEVKVIFDGVQVLMLAGAALAAAGCVWLLRQGRVAFLKLAAIFTVALPAVLGLLVAVSWEAFFVGFHQLFFNNDYWIFDAGTDPVILILPDGFFLHCAIMILGLVVLGGGVLYLAYRLLCRRQRKKRAPDITDF